MNRPGFERLAEVSLRCPGCDEAVRVQSHLGEVSHPNPVCGRWKELEADRDLAKFLQEVGAVVSGRSPAS